MPLIRQVRPVAADGRVVIPWAVQRELGIEEGGSVCFVVEDGIVTLLAAGPGAAEAAPAEADNDRLEAWAELRAELAKLLITLGPDDGASAAIRWERAAIWADADRHTRIEPKRPDC